MSYNFVPENARDSWKAALHVAKHWGDIEEVVRSSVSMIEAFDEQMQSIRKSAKAGRVLDGLDDEDNVTSCLIGKLEYEKMMEFDCIEKHIEKIRCLIDDFEEKFKAVSEEPPVLESEVSVGSARVLVTLERFRQISYRRLTELELLVDNCDISFLSDIFADQLIIPIIS